MLRLLALHLLCSNVLYSTIYWLYARTLLSWSCAVLPPVVLLPVSCWLLLLAGARPPSLSRAGAA